MPGDRGAGDQIGRGRPFGALVAGNVIDAPLERDEMKLAANNGERHFEAICTALLDKGLLAGYTHARGVSYPIPGE